MKRGVNNKFSLGQYAGVCAIILTLSLVIVWIAFQRRTQIISVLDRGPPAQATTGEQFHGKSSGTRYGFGVNGVDYGGSTSTLYPPGQTLAVRYLPENPSVNFVDGSLSRTNADRLMLGSLAVGPIYCGIAGIIFLVRRRRPS